MASTALTALNFVEHQPSRPAAVEADLVEPETQMTEVASLKTPSAAREAAATEDTHAAKINIDELSNTHKEQQQEEEDALKAGVTSQQDAATTVAVMPTALARCLTGLPTAREKEDIQEIERLLSGPRETSGGAIPSTTGCSRLKSGGGSCPKIKVKSGSGNSLGNDSSNGRSDSQGIQGNTDESDFSSSNADVLRLSVHNEEATTTVNINTFAVAATTAVDQAAEALSTRRQTHRAQQQNEDDLLTSSLQAVLQHRQNILEQENREMKEVLDLATQCKDREALAPKIQMLKEQLLAREQQHHAEKRELAATVKALLSASRCENEKERTELDLQRQIPQREQRSPQTEEKQGSTFCPQTRQEEAVDRDNDEKQQSKILQAQLYIADEMQGPQQQKQLDNLFCKSCVSMEKRKTPKPASTIGSGQQNSREEESRTAPESNKVRVSPVDSTVHASSKKELASTMDPAVKKEAPKTVETASKEASTSTVARCEQRCKPSKEVEQPRQQQSKQQRQAVDEDKDSARRLKKNGSWWRQQVVNRLRLPGPNLTRKQFLSTFHHPETGVEAPLLNAVFDRLKIIVRPSEGIAEEAVTIPHVLDLLEKTNGSNILHTLDAAELLEANVRCIDRKMASQKTDLQVFAIRLMCRFFLALSKKTFGELEMTCRRVAPREAVRTYTEELENYRQTLIKAIAAEKNITIDQSTVVVSKCIHNMRTELQNDLVMLQRVPPEARATQAEKPVIDLAKCRAQNSTLDKLTSSENNSAPTLTTKGSKSAADAVPHKLSAGTSPLAVSVQTATLPSMYSYGAVRRVAAPGCPPFTASEIQALSNGHVSASPHGGAAAAAAAHAAAVAVPYAAPGVLPSNGSLVSTTLNSSAAASSPPLSSVGSAARPTVVLPSENAEPQQNGRISAPKVVRGIADQAGKPTESEVLRQAARRQAQTKGAPCEKESPVIFEEISGASTTKTPTAAAAPAGTAAACTTPAENISQQGTTKREKDLSNLVQIIEYRYADGTPVTNPAHLPEGAKAVEAAARARLEETARVAQEAARRAEAVALAQFTAATAAGGGGTAAASVAAAQYQRAFAALSSNQESGHHDGTYPKLNAETEDAGNFSDSTVQRISPTIAAPNAVAQEEQQLQQAAPRGLQTMWKPQHVLAPTAVGGILRPLPAAVVAAAAVRRPAAPQPAPTSGTIGEAAAEGVAAQKGNETTGALLQRVSSFRGRTPGEYAFPSTDRAAPMKNPAAPADYSAAAAGLVPPGFPAAAAGQLQALLQQQRLLTAMPSMVVSAPKPTTAAYDTTQRATQASATAAGTPSTSRGRVSRSLTPKATERDSFMRRSRGGCMGTSPRRKSKRSSNSSSRTASVSSIQRAAGRFFASLGLWKSDGEDEEEDTSSSSEAALHAHDGLAAATEQYLNGQQEKLQQQQEGQSLVPQQLSLQHLQQQKLQQQQQLQQQQLQQQQLQQQHLQQQLQHQQLQQQLQQATVLPGLPAFPAGPPSRISTACEASPAELLPKATPGDGVAGRAGIYSMSPGVQQQALRHYVASDAAEHVAADPRAYCTENATEKNFLPVYSTLYAQQQYRLAQQQKHQEEQQHQQQQRPPSGEAWISTQSFLLKEVPGRILAEQSTSSQLRAPEKSTPAALTAATAIEKRFTATMESILSAEAGEEEKKAAATTAEKPTGYVLSSPQRDFASVQLETQADQQQRDQQQSYTAGAELAEKKTAKQQLQQVFLQQQRGGIQGGYNQATSRDTSVVTTHIPQQTDSPNAMHAAPAAAYAAADPLTQQTEGSQTMTSAIAGRQEPADGARVGQEAEASTATHPTVSSPCSAPAVGHSSNAAGALQARQQPEPSQPVPPAFSPAAVAFAAPVASSRVPQQPQISNTAAISSCAAAYATPTLGAAAFPPSVVRTRVSSIAEVPSPQLGAQQIGNFAQVQAQLDSLTQRQIEAYAQHYGLYATPQAAAAALGGVPLAGVGALGGPATCNGYAQFMSQHRPLPAVPPNYVFTKSS